VPSEANQKVSMPTKEYKNSLGMTFIPVEGTAVLFSKYPTTVGQYTRFVKSAFRQPRKAYHNETLDHPVVNVSWYDAKAFCCWLTEKERKKGLISPVQEYRLPMDWEWSVAVGLKEHKEGTPLSKDGKIKDKFPWGDYFPPTRADAFCSFSRNQGELYSRLEPVGSHNPTQLGLYDMGACIHQWCEDCLNKGSYRNWKVVRGGAHNNQGSFALLSSARNKYPRHSQHDDIGFRCVLVSDNSRNKI
jgi:formylglycine-generating enzyme required for sulfatase activity